MAGQTEQVSQAEQRRRSRAASELYTAASTIEIYGHDLKVAARLRIIADDIRQNGACS